MGKMYRLKKSRNYCTQNNWQVVFMILALAFYSAKKQLCLLGGNPKKLC